MTYEIKLLYISFIKMKPRKTKMKEKERKGEKKTGGRGENNIRQANFHG